ncbi:hypothetical protein TSUD_279780 [Trifolium subterraneum]|uniref:Retrotransposon gag domain-containing protein n=1 Tax=Trifolium subterraneum TaxID=3900 RepID=A0A2Z6NAN8_TRISU|nr:hypothetical protein TSUD_279780 [Trifolium subterraneum]
MRRRVPADQLLFDPKIERTARKNNSQKKKRKQLAKQKKLQEGTSVSIPSISPIFEEVMEIPEQEANNGGGAMPCHNSLPHQDPYNHLVKFYEISGSLGTTVAEEEAVFMRMFPHSLIGQAKDWYLDQPTPVMTNWNTLEEKFLERFFPHHKFMEAKTSIAVFSQGANETLNEAWERYKSMLRKCPNHGFDDLTQIHIFRNGLLQQIKLLLDATAGGSLLSLSAVDATAIIEKMALSDRQGDYNRNPSQRKPGVLELDTSDAVLAQNKLLTNTVDQLSKQMTKMLNLQEEASKAKQQRQGQYQNNTGYQRGNNSNYGQGWKHDVGTSNRQRQYESYNQPPPMQNQNSKIEESLSKLMEMVKESNQQNQQYQRSNDVVLRNFETQLQQNQQYQRTSEAATRNLETQLGQLAKQIANNNNQGGPFTANTEPNPKDCKSIKTRSDIEIGKGIGDNLEKERTVVEAREKGKEKIEGSECEAENKKEGLVEKEKNQKNEKNEKNECEGEVSEERESRILHSKKEKNIQDIPPIQHLPYPRVPTKKDKERQYARFLDIFKRLQISLPFPEVLEQMPTYAKFMKEILTKKRSFHDEETIQLDASCSAIIQRTLPTKEKDPGRVTLPVTIGNNWWFRDKRNKDDTSACRQNHQTSSRNC